MKKKKSTIQKYLEAKEKQTLGFIKESWKNLKKLTRKFLKTKDLKYANKVLHEIESLQIYLNDFSLIQEMKEESKLWEE